MSVIQRIERSPGITASERILRAISDEVFMDLWTYPNVYFKRGQSPPKELCDLLVIFGEHIFLFQDKHIAFPQTGNLERDWLRWYARAVEKGTEQLYGAERTLADPAVTLYLDAKGTKPMPLGLPPKASRKTHRILVARGAAKRCVEEMGGSGTLMILSDSDEQPAAIPFRVGIGKPGHFVHILDDHSLQIVFGYLDTFADITAYFSKKEALLSGPTKFMITGEEELLAHYASHMVSDSEHGFVFDAKRRADFIAIMEGDWQNFLDSSASKARAKANAISGLWDTLARRFTGHLVAGTSLIESSDCGITDFERLLRWMGAEDRFSRRMLSEKLAQMIEAARDGKYKLALQKPITAGARPYWILLVMPHIPGMDHEQYRGRRRTILAAYAYVTKHLHPDALDIVGVAINGIQDRPSSEDAMYLNTRTWTDEEAKQARELHELGLFKRMKEQHWVGDEFPDS